MLIVFGDTNTTLGGAIAASKLHIPVAHVEAGLRSFNKSMPEEINRVLCDHVSTLLFSPTETGVNNLIKEGLDTDNNPPYSPDQPEDLPLRRRDVRYRPVFTSKKRKYPPLSCKKPGSQAGNYALCTIHRDHNTDDPARLSAILSALEQIMEEFKMPVVIPVHPRTAKMLKSLPDQTLLKRLESNPLFIRIDPVGYLDMLMLESHSRMILTDSGGVQKESYFFRKPCIVLRPETEWKELIEQGTATIANAEPGLIMESLSGIFILTTACPISATLWRWQGCSFHLPRDFVIS